MGDHDERLAMTHRLKRLLDVLLRLRIQRARGLIEDQDARVLQEHAGQCEALTLAA